MFNLALASYQDEKEKTESLIAKEKGSQIDGDCLLTITKINRHHFSYGICEGIKRFISKTIVILKPNLLLRT